MSLSSQPESAKPSADSILRAAGELNTLLQIISGISFLLRKARENGESSEKYLAMVRTGSERAGKIATGLAQKAGGTQEKTPVQPELASFVESTKDQNFIPAKQSTLLVDDEQMTLSLVKHILTEADYCAVALSGSESLDQFRRQPYNVDLVRPDPTKPCTNGEETVGRLKKIRSDVAVAVCTGFIQHERVDPC